MSKILAMSFVVDLLAALGSIAYGLYADLPLWVWGGVAGFVFSFIWRRVSPKLMGKMMHKQVPPTPITANAPEVPLAEKTVDVLAGRRVTSPGAPHPETGAMWNRFSATPLKKGELRYY